MLQDKPHAIYVITNILTEEQYVGIAAIHSTVQAALHRRMQKHTQRAMTENKDWRLCINLREYGPEAFTYGLIEIVPDKATAHIRERDYILAYHPILNTAV